MAVLWGLIVAAIGALFVIWGRTRSEFAVYRVLVARSQILWGDRVHTFYRVSGAAMVVVGVIIAIAA